MRIAAFNGNCSTQSQSFDKILQIIDTQCSLLPNFGSCIFQTHKMITFIDNRDMFRVYDDWPNIDLFSHNAIWNQICDSSVFGWMALMLSIRFDAFSSEEHRVCCECVCVGASSFNSITSGYNTFVTIWPLSMECIECEFCRCKIHHRQMFA